MKRLLYTVFFAVPVVAVMSFGLYKKLSKEPIVEYSLQVPIDQAQKYVEKEMGRTADFFPDEGVFKINIPRADIAVSIGEFRLDPFMGLTTWIGFQKGIKKGVEIMAMGDWALLEHEVHPVMSAALAHDIKITALHNHFFGDMPHIYFMHIEVEGSLQGVTAGICAMQKAMVDAVEVEQSSLPSSHAIHGDRIEKIIPVSGVAKDGMFKIVIGRQIKASCGCPVGKNMGINSWIAFGGTDENAVVDGDFALFEDEVQPVIQALNRAGIHVVAVHNHMIHEQPRLLYVHFWAYGSAIDIAQGLRGAIDQTSMLTTGLQETDHKQYPCKGCGRVK